jgi:hypothetical protein
MDNAQIIFQDIECPKLRQQLTDMVDELIQLSPSDAAFRATFQHIQDHFLAEIKVASESVYMTVADEASAFGDMMDHVRAKLLSQIVDWRNQRFAV